MTKEHHFSH